MSIEKSTVLPRGSHYSLPSFSPTGGRQDGDLSEPNLESFRELWDSLTAYPLSLWREWNTQSPVALASTLPLAAMTLASAAFGLLQVTAQEMKTSKKGTVHPYLLEGNGFQVKLEVHEGSADKSVRAEGELAYTDSDGTTHQIPLQVEAKKQGAECQLSARLPGQEAPLEIHLSRISGKWLINASPHASSVSSPTFNVLHTQTLNGSHYVLGLSPGDDPESVALALSDKPSVDPSFSNRQFPFTELDAKGRVVREGRVSARGDAWVLASRYGGEERRSNFRVGLPDGGGAPEILVDETMHSTGAPEEDPRLSPEKNPPEAVTKGEVDARRAREGQERAERARAKREATRAARESAPETPDLTRLPKVLGLPDVLFHPSVLAAPLSPTALDSLWALPENVDVDLELVARGFEREGLLIGRVGTSSPRISPPSGCGNADMRTVRHAQQTLLLSDHYPGMVFLWDGGRLVELTQPVVRELFMGQRAVQEVVREMSAELKAAFSPLLRRAISSRLSRAFASLRLPDAKQPIAAFVERLANPFEHWQKIREADDRHPLEGIDPDAPSDGFNGRLRRRCQNLPGLEDVLRVANPRVAAFLDCRPGGVRSPIQEAIAIATSPAGRSQFQICLVSPFGPEAPHYFTPSSDEVENLFADHRGEEGEEIPKARRKPANMTREVFEKGDFRVVVGLTQARGSTAHTVAEVKLWGQDIFGEHGFPGQDGEMPYELEFPFSGHRLRYRDGTLVECTPSLLRRVITERVNPSDWEIHTPEVQDLIRTQLRHTAWEAISRGIRGIDRGEFHAFIGGKEALQKIAFAEAFDPVAFFQNRFSPDASQRMHCLLHDRLSGAMEFHLTCTTEEVADRSRVFQEKYGVASGSSSTLRMVVAPPVEQLGGVWDFLTRGSSSEKTKNTLMDRFFNASVSSREHAGSAAGMMTAITARSLWDLHAKGELNTANGIATTLEGGLRMALFMGMDKGLTWGVKSLAQSALAQSASLASPALKLAAKTLARENVLLYAVVPLLSGIAVGLMSDPEMRQAFFHEGPISKAFAEKCLYHGVANGVLVNLGLRAGLGALSPWLGSMAGGFAKGYVTGLPSALFGEGLSLAGAQLFAS